MTPAPKGEICAVGAVDRTFYRQDGITNASEAARNELARSVQVTINSVMYDIETQRGSSVRQYMVSEVVAAVQDGVVNGAEIRSTWFDHNGQLAGAGMTYALACMRTDQSVEQLAERMKAVLPDKEDEKTVAAVRQRAEDAFAELEREEERRVARTSTATQGNVPQGSGVPSPAFGQGAK